VGSADVQQFTLGLERLVDAYASARSHESVSRV
jgi:hypothetical protein